MSDTTLNSKYSKGEKFLVEAEVTDVSLNGRNMAIKLGNSNVGRTATLNLVSQDLAGQKIWQDGIPMFVKGSHCKDGDRIEIGATVIDVSPWRVVLKVDGVDGDVAVSSSVEARLVNREKTPGQKMWDALRREAAERTDGSAHPTVPWHELKPETREKYERQARLVAEALA